MHADAKDELTSGFVRLDFLLAFTVADEGALAAASSRCAREDWYGTRGRRV